MNSLSCLIFGVVVVLGFFTHKSTCFELSLCLDDYAGGACQVGDSPALNSAIANSNAANVIRNAYSKYNASINAAGNTAKRGVSDSIRLQRTNPRQAAKDLMEAMESSKNMITDAMANLHVSLGEALSYTNGSARQGLEKAIQKLMLYEFELMDRCDLMSSLAQQVLVTAGGDAAIQALQAAGDFLQAGFAALYYLAEAAKQIAMMSLSETSVQQVNQDSSAAQQDNDVLNIIKQINDAASVAIRRGAPASEIDPVRKSFIRPAVDIARVSANVREYYARVVQLANSDREAARNIYLSESKGVCKDLQEITSDVLLTIGSQSLRGSRSNRKELLTSMKLVYRGYMLVIVGNKNAKRSTLFGLLFEDDHVRGLSTETAVGSSRFGKMDYLDSIVDGAKKTFDFMAMN